jgi:hypothetical protein
MRDQSFAPMAVEAEKTDQYRVVRTLTEAADVLLNPWPEKKGEKHRKALACGGGSEGCCRGSKRGGHLCPRSA